MPSRGIKNNGGAASEEVFSVSKNIKGVKLRARATGELITKNLNLEATLKKASATTKVAGNGGTTGGGSTSGENASGSGSDSGAQNGTINGGNSGNNSGNQSGSGNTDGNGDYHDPDGGTNSDE